MQDVVVRIAQPDDLWLSSSRDKAQTLVQTNGRWVRHKNPQIDAPCSMTEGVLYHSSHKVATQ